MDIFETGDFSREIVESECKKLEEAFPGIHFPQWINFRWGRITGYKYSFSGAKVIEAYHNLRIAVINEEIPGPEEAEIKLRVLGYHVPERRMKLVSIRTHSDDIDDDAERNRALTPEEILWDEMRAGRHLDLIKSRLENLLDPIVSSISGVKEFEFAVYDPCIVISSDDQFPPYITYDELFRMPARNGGVDVNSLVERIKNLPEGRALALSSKVQTGEGERHIPMIDFSTSWTGLDFESALDVLDSLKLDRNILVSSGKCFHYYGNQLMNRTQFYDFLNQLGKYPAIGENWPWLQATQDFALLRITPSASKPYFPIVEEV